MPSQPYNLVKDEPDLRVPLHSDESFYTGISFQAKVGNVILIQTTSTGVENCHVKSIMLTIPLVCRIKTIEFLLLLLDVVSFVLSCILSQS